jgi:translocation and assembly module TamB
LVLLVGLVAAGGLFARYGVLLPQSRGLIESRLNGMKVSRFGRLRLEGLEGDVWRDFTVRRLTIRDEKGIWLEARQVHVRWHYAQLLRRRVIVDELTSADVDVYRRPVLTPAGPQKPPPVSLDLKDARFRLQTHPVFSGRRGLFQVGAKLSTQRIGGGAEGTLTAVSLLHQGDHLYARFQTGKLRPLLVRLSAVEAQGGAIAGSLGMDPARPFSATLNADGKPSAGQLRLRVYSGGELKAWTDGGWTGAGGDFRGRLELGASTLLRKYVRKAGPVLTFSIAARKARGGLYGVGLVASAENLRLRARGPLDIGRRAAPRGLWIDLRVPEVSRIIQWRFVGGVRLVGTVTGDQAAWRFTGNGAADGLSYGGYRLVRVAGPLRLAMAKGELRVFTTLQGAGGSGSGLYAGLAGRTPRLFLDLSRFPDGRILIRQLRLVGSAFRLDASGSRGPFGALNFKGDFRVADASIVRRGARGAVSAAFTAGQAKGGRPWVVSLNGRGERFGSGMKELDRLLGPAPRFKLAASLGRGLFSIANAEVDGAVGHAAAAGVVGPGDRMKLAVNWRANGPFRAGPVEITGRVTGRGLVSGTFGAPKADLVADIARLDVPRLPLRDAHVILSFRKIARSYDGLIAINGTSEYGPARGRAAFGFRPGGLDLNGLDVDAAGVQAAGSLSLRGGAPSTADLRVAAGPGVLLSRGTITGTMKIVDTAGRPTWAAVNLAATDAVIRGSDVLLTRANLVGQGPLSGMPFKLTAQGTTKGTPFSFNGGGGYAQIAGRQELSLNGSGAIRGVAYRTLEPLRLGFGKGGRTVRAHIGTIGGEAFVDARSAGGGFNMTGRLRNVDLKAIRADFAGRVDADVTMQGRGSALSGTMTATLDDARTVDAPADLSVDGRIRAVLSGGRLELTGSAFNARGLRSNASVVLPVDASADPLRLRIAATRPISGRFDASGEVKPLWDLFLSGGRELQGKVQMAGTIGGTLHDPRLNGHASVAGGRFEDYSTGLVLTNVALDANLENEVIAVTRFTGRDPGKGEIEGSGRISLLRGGTSSFRANLKRFQIIDNDTATATASGAATVERGADGKARVVADLTIDRAEINAAAQIKRGVVSIDVREVNKPKQLEAQLAPPKPRGALATLDVRLNAPRRVFVEGRGIDAELSLRARVTGTTSAPVLDGVARIYRGTYELAGRRFEFEERGAIYLSTRPSEIRLDLSAVSSEPSLSVTVNIRGVATDPEINLSSSPSLPQDEILSQLLFGSGASQLSGVQAAQVASTVASLAGGGGFDVLGNLRELAGLDRLSFANDSAGGFAVAGGKYLTDDLYLEIIGGGVEGARARVDYRVRRNFSIFSDIGGQVGARVGVRWRKDFGQRRDIPRQGGRARPAPPGPPPPSPTSPR